MSKKFNDLQIGDIIYATSDLLDSTSFELKITKISENELSCITKESIIINVERTDEKSQTIDSDLRLVVYSDRNDFLRIYKQNLERALEYHKQQIKDEERRVKEIYKKLENLLE